MLWSSRGHGGKVSSDFISMYAPGGMQLARVCRAYKELVVVKNNHSQMPTAAGVVSEAAASMGGTMTPPMGAPRDARTAMTG